MLTQFNSTQLPYLVKSMASQILLICMY